MTCIKLPGNERKGQACPFLELVVSFLPLSSGPVCLWLWQLEMQTLARLLCLSELPMGGSSPKSGEGSKSCPLKWKGVGGWNRFMVSLKAEK